MGVMEGDRLCQKSVLFPPPCHGGIQDFLVVKNQNTEIFSKLTLEIKSVHMEEFEC